MCDVQLMFKWFALRGTNTLFELIFADPEPVYFARLIIYIYSCWRHRPKKDHHLTWECIEQTSCKNGTYKKQSSCKLDSDIFF